MNIWKNYAITIKFKKFFTHTVTLKKRTVKKVWNDLDFFPSAKFLIAHSSTMNICEYIAAVLKIKGIQDKHHERSKSSHQKCSVETVFLKISQIWQGNICARVSF